MISASAASLSKRCFSPAAHAFDHAAQHTAIALGGRTMKVSWQRGGSIRSLSARLVTNEMVRGTSGERIVHRGYDLVDRNLLIAVAVSRLAAGQRAGAQRHVHQRNDFIHGDVAAGVAVAVTASWR
jgi:hypothetical protein